MGHVRRPRLTAAKVFARCPPCLRMNEKAARAGKELQIGVWAAISVLDMESIRSMMGVASKGGFSNTPSSSAFPKSSRRLAVGVKTAHSHQALPSVGFGTAVVPGEGRSQWW